MCVLLLLMLHRRTMPKETVRVNMHKGAKWPRLFVLLLLLLLQLLMLLTR